MSQATSFQMAIASLGDTPESVTEALQSLGIKGYKCSARSCPIAKYLNALGFPDVTVASKASRYKNSTDIISEESVFLPEGVCSWIRRFDDNMYPEFQLEPID